MGDRTGGQGPHRRRPRGRQAGLRAYDLATGRPIGESTGVVPPPTDNWVFSSWIAPDDRAIAVPKVEGDGPAARLKFLVWRIDKGETISIDSRLDTAWSDGLARFNAEGTRLLISGPRKTEIPAPKQQPILMGNRRYDVEYWDLAGPKRLMSSADGAPELAPGDSGNPKVFFDPRRRAFATIHDPTKNPDRIAAILWETATGKLIGRYRGNVLYQAEYSDYLAGSTTRASTA